MACKKITTLVAAVLMLCVAALAEAPVFTADKHKAAGFKCEDCHGTAPKDSIDQTACLKCHESMKAVAKRTADMDPNPHDNHMSDQASCLDCHHGHRANEVMCSQCHQDKKFERNTKK
ncbi:MAG: cytochrome c3 family protein [Acidobacteriota bacterium]|nr:cytochrome c3 family protein [Acidobacteriota bacterium]